MRLPWIVTAACLLNTGLFAASVSPGNFIVDQLDPSGGGFSTDGEFAFNNSFGSGFVNVVDGSGNWLVQNLPVGLDSSGMITDRFNISGSATQVSTDNLKVDFNATPLTDAPTSIAGDPLQNISVAQLTLAIGGTGPDDDEDGVAPPGANVTFNGAAPFLTGTYQTGHPNVEAGVNQCAPAAVANSLTFLGVATTPNNPGTGANPNNSLVGTLDNTMGRSLTGCNGGPCGVWPLDGKLQYLGNIGQTGLDVNFQDAGNGAGDAGNGNTLGAGNYTRNGVTANNRGTPSFDFIQSEIAKGEDVEIDIQWNCGTVANPRTCRHYVEVTGAGTIMGQQWITHVSDQLQGQAGGVNSTQFDWVSGTNGLPGWGAGAVIDQVISESTPEPATIALFGLGLLALTGARRYRAR